MCCSDQNTGYPCSTDDDCGEGEGTCWVKKDFNSKCSKRKTCQGTKKSIQNKEQWNCATHADCDNEDGACKKYIPPEKTGLCCSNQYTGYPCSNDDDCGGGKNTCWVKDGFNSTCTKRKTCQGKKKYKGYNCADDRDCGGNKDEYKYCKKYKPPPERYVGTCCSSKNFRYMCRDDRDCGGNKDEFKYCWGVNEDKLLSSSCPYTPRNKDRTPHPLGAWCCSAAPSTRGKPCSRYNYAITGNPGDDLQFCGDNCWKSTDSLRDCPNKQ